MGEVYRPEDVVRRRGREVPDLGPGTVPKPTTPTSLDDLIREVRELRAEVEKIKMALNTRGISI